MQRPDIQPRTSHLRYIKGQKKEDIEMKKIHDINKKKKVLFAAFFVVVVFLLKYTYTE